VTASSGGDGVHDANSISPKDAAHKPLSFVAEARALRAGRYPTNGNGRAVDAPPYVVAAVNGECEKVRRAVVSTRNSTLNNAALALGHYVGGDVLAEVDAVEHLTTAAYACGLTEPEVGDTIRSGMTKGKTEPRGVPEREAKDYPPAPAWGDEHGASDVGPRRSWRPVEMGAVIDGDYAQPTPTVGARSDGVGLLYRGRTHTAVGESEALKTWLADVITVHELARGNACLRIDFEDDAPAIVRRLLTLGADSQALRDRFAYIRPDEALNDTGRDDLDQALGDLRPVFACLDGVTEGMTMHGLNPLDNVDIAKYGRLLSRRIARHGAAALDLDHVVKDREGRGRYALGGVHKLNAVTGAAFVLESREPFGIGLAGRSTVRIAKDRPGQLKRHGVAGRDRSTWFADLVLISHHADFIEASIDPPVERSDTFRPTTIMRRVSDALAKADRPLPKIDVEERVTGKAETVRLALATLVDEHYVTVEVGARGAQLHRLIRPFTEAEL
jgi:hypothetical protein